VVMNGPNRVVRPARIHLHHPHKERATPSSDRRAATSTGRPEVGLAGGPTYAMRCSCGAAYISSSSHERTRIMGKGIAISVGLAAGIALGFAGAFGGFNAFMIVLVMAVIGAVAGAAVAVLDGRGTFGDYISGPSSGRSDR